MTSKTADWYKSQTNNPATAQIPFTKRENLEKMLDKLEQPQIIEQTNDWIFNLFMTPKPNPNEIEWL